MELVANFTLNNEALDAQFDVSEITNFDALFQIYANPEKVSQLENDLNYQTGEQVAESIQAESDVINARIDEEVQTINAELDTKVSDVVATGVIEATREENIITLKSVNFVFEQGIASDTWVIEHNLNKYPAVTVTDSAGTQFAARVIYDSLNQCTIYMNGATKGKAYLN